MRSIKILTLIALVCTLCTVSSCKKDSGDVPSKGKSSLTAKVNGTVTVFDKLSLGLTGSVNGQEFTSLQGTAADGSNMSLTINGPVIAGKTYSVTAVNYEDSGSIFYTTKDDVTFVNDDVAANQVSITVTGLSGKTIKGAFKGGVKAMLNNSEETRAITEGTFNVTVAE